MNSTQQIKYGSLISYIAIVVNIIIGILYTPWMIRCIGKADYGLYTLALSVISFFMMDFGLCTAVARFVSNYLAQGENQKIKNMLGLVVKLYMFLDIIILFTLVAFYFCIPYIYGELTPSELGKFEVIYCIAAFFSVFSFPFIPLTGILIAYEKFVELKCCDLFQKLLIVGMVSFCLAMGKGVYALVVVNTIAGILGILMKLYFVRSLNTGLNLTYQDKSELRGIIGFSGWTTIVALAQRFIITLAPTILGIFSGSESIAILGIVISLESYVYMYANAINGMLLPKVSRVIHQERQSILPLMVKVGRLQILMIGLVFWGFMVLGKDFVSLWLGDGFEEVYLCTLLLIVPSYIMLPQDIAVQAMNVLNYMKQMAYVYIVASVINILLALLLAKFFGVLGLCTSIFISYMVRTIGLDIVFKKKMDIDVVSFFRASFGKMIWASLVTVIICSVLFNYIPGDGLVLFLIKGLLFCISYAICNYCFAMNSYEKTFIFNIIKTLIR